MPYTLFYSDLRITEDRYRATKRTPACVPYRYDEFDDALAMARDINARGGIAWEIEGDIGTIGPGEIARQIRDRATELKARPKVR